MDFGEGGVGGGIVEIWVWGLWRFLVVFDLRDLERCGWERLIFI